MIHIDLTDVSPSKEWIARADAVTQELIKGKYTKEQRNAIIDSNDKLWRELEPWLNEISHGKCWYSEARDCAAYWHVDHFRPKKEIKDDNGDTYEGYWWLAFNWKNYRLAGGAINVRKSTKFPMREGTHWACTPKDDEDDEFPYLLDPVRPEDPCLLTFDEQGKAHPAEPDKEWHRQRAEFSIRILNLNYDNLSRGRKLIWDLCERHAKDALRCHATIEVNPSASKKQKLKDAVLALRAMVCSNAEFSATAATCVRAMGSLWLERAVLR